MSGKKLHIVYASSEISVGSMACCIYRTFRSNDELPKRKTKTACLLAGEAVCVIDFGPAPEQKRHGDPLGTPYKTPAHFGSLEDRFRSFWRRRETTALAVVVGSTV